MSRSRITVNSHSSTTASRRRKYGFGSFLFDIIMCVVTGGLWLIWIFVREMRG